MDKEDKEERGAETKDKIEQRKNEHEINNVSGETVGKGINEKERCKEER